MVVGVLDARLDPVLVVDAHEDAGLVELPVPGGAERHVHRLADGQRGEQCVLRVVHEAVGGVAPGVAAFDGGHVEVLGGGGEVGGGVCPGAFGPGDDV